MLEAAIIWNESSNKPHWDPEADLDRSISGRTVVETAKPIEAVNPAVKRVLGGISPIDALHRERKDRTITGTSTWA